MAAVPAMVPAHDEPKAYAADPACGVLAEVFAGDIKALQHLLGAEPIARSAAGTSPLSFAQVKQTPLRH